MTSDRPNNPSERRLLIVSCTRRKNRLAGVLPAWERYEGGCFPLLKQLQASHRLPSDVDLFIISAKYGLLRPNDCIKLYDQSMTQERANLLQPEVTRQMYAYLTQTVYTQTCIVLEALYLHCLHGLDFPNPTYLESLSAQHLLSLEKWLLSPASGETSSLPASITNSQLTR